MQEPLPLAEVPPEPEPAPAAAPLPPVVVAPAPQTAAAFDARTYASDVGLQLVETRASAAPASTDEPEAVKLGRPRRERPKPAVEELVQVETHK